MSSATHGRFRLTGLFQAACRWLRDEPEPRPAPPAARVTGAASPPEASVHTGPPPASAAPSGCVTGDTLHLPLQPVLDGLPQELKARIRRPEVGALTIPVPMSKVMSQLATGMVRISFGELRLAAPGVFTLATDCDSVPVSLPLAEILARIDRATLLARRPTQKTVTVPDHVTSPFEDPGSVCVLKQRQQPAGVQSMPGAPSGSGAAPRLQRPADAPPRSATAVPAPAGLGARQRPTAPPPPARTVPSAETPPLPKVTPAVAPPPIPMPGKPGGNGQSKPPPLAQHARAGQLASPPLVAPAAVSPVPGADRIEIPLLPLLSTWPQAVQMEVAQVGGTEAKVVIPAGIIEKGLRIGKIEFPWRLVRAWIQPPVQSAAVASDDTPLQFPLNIVAPLFFARRRPAHTNRPRVTLDETIPNLFFGFPQSDAGLEQGNAAPVTAPSPARPPDTNFYTKADAEAQAPVTEPAREQATTGRGTDFMRRQAVPAEIVARAVALEGVAGALVVLPDGLAVASRVPATCNGDTLAAFVPQIFNRVSQCTNELRMGALNNLSFTVGNVPWKVFRVNNLFFAAFGRAEQPLPTGDLAALAVEMHHKTVS